MLFTLPHSLRVLLSTCVFGLFSLQFSAIYGQDQSPVVQEKVSQATVSDTPTQAAKETFAKEQRLESLRYKHLWIAFSVIWLLVFVFVWRTWQRSQQTADRLTELRDRLKKLEEK